MVPQHVGCEGVVLAKVAEQTHVLPVHLLQVPIEGEPCHDLSRAEMALVGVVPLGVLHHVATEGCRLVLAHALPAVVASELLVDDPVVLPIVLLDAMRPALATLRTETARHGEAGLGGVGELEGSLHRRGALGGAAVEGGVVDLGLLNVRGLGLLHVPRFVWLGESGVALDPLAVWAVAGNEVVVDLLGGRVVEDTEHVGVDVIGVDVVSVNINDVGSGRVVKDTEDVGVNVLGVDYAADVELYGLLVDLVLDGRGLEAGIVTVELRVG